jgi:hypothetical protein
MGLEADWAGFRISGAESAKISGRASGNERGLLALANRTRLDDGR